MMQERKCHCCGKPILEGEAFYHKVCARRVFSSAEIPALNYTQEELNALAKQTVLGRISVPGVQPKLSLHLERGENHSRSRMTLVGLEGDYILKPQTPQWPFLPEAEHFCMKFAEKCGISTVACGLIPLKSGELAYITRRMDRIRNQKLHLEDFCQILNKTTEQKYNGSMEQIGKAIRLYSDTPGLDLVRFFEITLFSFLTGNSDMHLKNFSLLRTQDGHYELSPAYDLVPVKVILPQDTEELALTLNGKKNHLKTTDFLAFGHTLQLSDAQLEKAFDRITKSVRTHLQQSLDDSFLPPEMASKISALVSERLKRLNRH